MLFTPAYAQAAGAAGGPGMLETLLPFVFIFVIMYFLIIRPQQKRAKDHKTMLGALRRGDEVVTQGGILAKITRVKDNDEEVEAEIGRAGSEPVRVRLIKSTITMVMAKTDPAGRAAGKPANANKPSGAKDRGGRNRDDAKNAERRDQDDQDQDGEGGETTGKDV